ncbi:MarR family winged helix-turn-helix transcriptional regulator [Nocardia shimofusensis]|uniref:MarR family winged helix-turn-helix transcriptional regulator n=1 Tax=Nocardia shimofusensis TaxID=228596 RepID=UPI001C3FDDE6|nr:MarR family winged helix-turn-helix transcriptional regulator [Nocardia shimofusensis]
MMHSDDDLDRRLVDALERLSGGVRALAQRSARDHGLTPLQQQVLLALSKNPPSRREVSALAAECDVTRPTMSDAVTALERKGLLGRSPGGDGRRRVLTPTPRGCEVVDDLREWDAPAVRTLLGVPVEDRAATLQTVLSMIAGLQRQGVISVARVCTSCRFFEAHAHSDRVAPHHCRLLNAPLPLTELRTDCPEHQPAA